MLLSIVFGLLLALADARQRRDTATTKSIEDAGIYTENVSTGLKPLLHNAGDLLTGKLLATRGQRSASPRRNRNKFPKNEQDAVVSSHADSSATANVRTPTEVQLFKDDSVDPETTKPSTVLVDNGGQKTTRDGRVVPQ